MTNTEKRITESFGAQGLLQERIKAILVDRDAYLLEVCRYVELNPVRAGMVSEPAEWPWSSYRAHVGQAPTPEWLDTAGLHDHLLGYRARSVADEQRAAQRYVALVAGGRDVRLWDEALRQQIYLGDEAFVKRMQALAVPQADAACDVPRVQRSKPATLSQWLSTCESRAQAFLCAHTQSGISMTAIAQEMDLSVSYVSRLIGRAEAALQARS